MKLKIAGGRVIDPAQNLDQVTDIYIDAGAILALGDEPEGFVAEEVIDASGQIVAPGFIDLCAQLGEPGQTQRGTIASETAAAAAGGITTLVTPPTTIPVVDTTAVAELIQDRAQDSGFARVLPLGALTKGLEGEQLAPMHALATSGCIGFSNARQPITSSMVLMRALEYAATHDLLVVFQAEDRSLVGSGCMHDGSTATRLGLIGIPAAAETIEVSRCLLLVEETGVRAHFGQLSCAGSVKLIEEARLQGLPVTADVSAHQLLLTDEQVDGFDSMFHVNPPFRSVADRDALRNGLVTGTITAICSDHQPQDEIAKEAPFAATEIGISSLETLLPLSLLMVEEGWLELPQLIERLSKNPAQILGIEAGTLEVGSAADIAIFDPELRWSPTADQLRSQGKNTPFKALELKGRVTLTLLGGTPVFRL